MPSVYPMRLGFFPSFEIVFDFNQHILEIAISHAAREV
jgi:hypothetical protein